MERKNIDDTFAMYYEVVEETEEDIIKRLIEVVSNFNVKDFLWKKVMNNEEIKEWIGDSEERKKIVKKEFQRIYVEVTL
jgi:hypothetical protein